QEALGLRQRAAVLPSWAVRDDAAGDPRPRGRGSRVASGLRGAPRCREEQRHRVLEDAQGSSARNAVPDRRSLGAAQDLAAELARILPMYLTQQTTHASMAARSFFAEASFSRRPTIVSAKPTP